jgi:hypothetical protein
MDSLGQKMQDIVHEIRAEASTHKSGDEEGEVKRANGSVNCEFVESPQFQYSNGLAYLRETSCSFCP